MAEIEQTILSLSAGDGLSILLASNTSASP
jgi:hypothetical protein